MMRGARMTEQTLIPSDVAAAAEYVAAAWRDGVASTFETGRRLIEVRGRFHNQPNKWSG